MVSTTFKVHLPSPESGEEVLMLDRELGRVGSKLGMLEWFLPSYPTLLSPTQPTVRSLVKVVPIDNIIDFGEGNYAAFRWTTISAGEDKNYIHELTTWEKVGRGGEEYGAGVWVPVTCAMVTSIPIVGSIRRCLVRLQSSLSTLPLPYLRLHLSSLALSTPRPLPGVLNLSIPFLKGPNIQLSITHPKGLPQLPHGGALEKTLNTLGLNNFLKILAALMLESKLLIVSPDSCLRSMVTEVAQALLYPLAWTWPVIPVLPRGMVELLQAPVPWILGIDGEDGMEHVGGDVVVIDLGKGIFGKGHEPGEELPERIGKGIKECWREWEEGKGEGRGKINYAEKEKKGERRFRVGVSLEISKYINSTGEVLGGRGGKEVSFARKLAATQMFSNFAERVEEEGAAFFHDLMDLGEISESRERAVNAGAAVLEEYERMVENWKMPTLDEDEEGYVAEEGGGGGFNWIVNKGKARSQTEEDCEFAYAVASAAAKRAAEIIKEGKEEGNSPKRGSGSNRSLGEKVGGGVDDSIDLSEVRNWGDYKVFGIFGEDDDIGGGEGGGREKRKWKVEECVREGREQRERKEQEKRERKQEEKRERKKE
ncbi:hypothetical protein TrCOL_g1475 [Triparma columacea]|uniref:UDENN domain-containing protein n=1 Tax=Triparma columacea TaxID=722753 RepID=A0A9W7G3F6_9STRA|nr:hypothetical protein TrCOL_g1475 [Triparma columacea]